ncbi:uncharacterized protein LOC120120298 [Hibiscus syriacus]|uniref:uncharacterized protein LOC120120298 n=1 Tax=Hibiscus syriacus TaxID=106335 RepID=UPI001924D2AF|nr:uncharacterized protein LOC120120298 [Hibiscus syriacus]
MSTTTSHPLLQSSSATATRRVPPPCWTKGETLVLIKAYKDKWFALRRRNLKALDWDAVSDAVSSASDPGTVKSSVQCRHKTEKMRKRYRAEKKQRIHLFISIFMNHYRARHDRHSISVMRKCYRSRLERYRDEESSVQCRHIDGNSGSSPGVHYEYGGGYGSSFNFDDRLGSEHGVKWHGNGDFVDKGTKNFKSNGRIGDGYGSIVDFDHSFAQDVDSLQSFLLRP